VKLLPDAGIVEAMPAAFVAQVEASLRRALDGELEDARSSTPDAAILVEELVRTVSSGGKRIRPVFCYWGYVAGGGAGPEALADVGAAIELLHTSALIHDDLVDGSKLRRGEPTSFRRLAGHAPPPEDAPTDAWAGDERFGRSAAILAGDLAAALSERLFTGAPFPPARILAASEHFQRARVDAIRGEYLDLFAAASGTITEDEARRVGALKAGSYTVVAPLLIGAAFAAAEGSVADALRAYGEPLGEAFQLRDDVLGTFGDPDVTGKDPDDDLREGKQTLLVVGARRLGDPAQRRALARGLGRADLSPDAAAGARAAIVDSGALRETLRAIDALAERARRAIERSSIRGSAASALVSLAGLVALREA
jgi:geranylgeranyl diphosphate synthase type I